MWFYNHWNIDYSCCVHPHLETYKSINCTGSVKWKMISKMSHRTTKWNECILGRLVVTVILVLVGFFFVLKIWRILVQRYTCLGLLLMSVLGFKAKGDPFIYVLHDRFLKFTSLWHMPISWWPAWQLIPFPTYLIKQWSMLESRRSWNHCHASLLTRLEEKWRVSTQTIQMDRCFDEVF